MQPDKAAAFLMTVIRAMFEGQSDASGPREFRGTIEWEFTLGWDDGDGMWRVIVAPGLSVWSYAFRAKVRPTVFIGVGSDAQPHNRHGVRPSVPCFDDQPAGSEPVPLADPRGTKDGYWAVIMNLLGGREPHLFGNGWVGFHVTLPDEEPWVAVRQS